MSLMERFADPDLIVAMTFGEKMTGSLVTMVMGIGTTFVVLVLLLCIISLTSKIFVLSEKKGAISRAATPAVAPAAAPAAQAEAVDIHGEKLVAAIAAAVAAFEGSSSTGGFVVRRIRRVQGPVNAWDAAGRAECTDSRKM